MNSLKDFMSEPSFIGKTKNFRQKGDIDILGRGNCVFGKSQAYKVT